MKILHVESGRHLYGGALQVCHLIAGLRQRGVENHLLCPLGSAVSRAAGNDCRVWPAATCGDLDPRFPLRMLALIRRHRPDLVHIHSRGADLWGALLAPFSAPPFVVTRRVDNPEASWLARLKYHRYARVISISQKIRSVLISQKVAPRHVAVIPSAVECERYRGRCAEDWFYGQFAIPRDRAVLGVIAQLIPRKGHLDLVAAIPGILRRFPKTHFLLLGRGPLRAELERRCREAGIAAAVTFAGFRDDIPGLLPCLTAVIHPAVMEGLGVALLQAAAAGRPIVAVRAGGVPEIVVDNHTGWLVPPGRPRQLAQAVIELLSDPRRAARMGRSARRRVERCFSLERMVSANLELYRRTLERRRR